MEFNMKKALPFRKRNLASLAALTLLVFSMFIGISAVPLKAAATAPSAIPPSLSEYEPLFTDYDSSKPGAPVTNIAPNLKTYLETGIAPDELRSISGALELYVSASNEVDLAELNTHMKIINVIRLELGMIIQGFVTDPKAIYTIGDLDGVGFVWGNEYHKVLQNRPIEGPATDNFMARKIMGVDQVEAEFPSIDGTGITIGIVDTGVDFGVTDLADAIALDALGQPTSFDPGGSGIAITSYALPVVGGYLLTEGLDFRMFRNDGSLWWSNSTYGIYAENMYVGPGITSTSGFYRIGMSVQVGDLLPRLFFVFILVDSTTPFVYDTLYVDLETSWAITADYNGVSTGIAAEWDFSDDDPHMFDSNPVIAEDFDGDGNNDFSMGSLSNTFDLMSQITGGLVSGIDPLGRGFAFMFDNGGHGTSCAGTAAGRGITEFDVYGNGTLYQIPGVAVGASIMSLKTFTIADDMWTWFWGCGYRATTTYDYGMAFEDWTYVGTDKADILSNSWGWSSFHESTGLDMVNSYDLYSMAMDYLTWETDTLFCVSTGNTGPGYGTVSRPESIFALMVGASTSSHIWQGFYSNYSQGYDTVADFTSVGPTPQGFLGVDILAVGAYAYEVVPLQIGDGTTFTAFGGTSQACPYAAGIAALVQQAGAGIPADYTRVALMNGADDLGYDIYRQGAGRINAYKSVHMAFGNDTDGTDPLPWIWTDESWFAQYWGDREDPIRGWYMYMYYGYGYGVSAFDGTALYHPSWTDPGFLADGAVFPGPIYRGDSYNFNVTATDWSGTGVDSLTAYTYDLLYEESATLFSSSTYTTFNITDEFSPTFLSNWAAADYAVIHVTYPQSNLDAVYDLSGQANYVFLHDWVEDTNGNGIIDFEGYGIAGEVRRIASDTAYGNSHTICLGNPASHFWGTPALYYHDVGVELFIWRQLNVNVTIQLFERTPWTWLTTSQYGIADPSYPEGWNITIDVPADAMPGCYQGYLEAIKGTGVTHMPVSFRVDANMDQPGPAGEISWGGAQDTPYDNGATYGNIQWGYRAQVGDWRVYFVDAYPYPSPPSYYLINVTWSDPDTRLDVMLYYSSYGYWLGETDFAWTNLKWTGSSTWSRQQVILFDVSRPGVGSWDYTWISRGSIGIAIRTSEFGASTGGPEDFWVTVSYGIDNHPDITPGVWSAPEVWMNASSTTMAMTALQDHMDLTGPRITLECNWSDLIIPEFPTIEIRQTRIELLSEVFHLGYGTIVEPVLAGWYPDVNPREGYDYVDLLAGQAVELSVEFGTWDGEPGLGTSITHAGDIDVFVWAPGVAHTYANSLTGGQTTTGANPEEGTFTAPASGTYTIGLDYYDGPVPMAWKTDVYAYQAIPVTNDGQAASMDTWNYITSNARYGVRAVLITGTTLDWDTGFSAVSISNVSFTNFFAPVISSIEPNGGETVGPNPFSINWTATDQNVALGDEVLGFSVEVSNDSGLTWKVITYGTTLNSLVWDPSNPYYGLPAGDQFLVRVNCTDGMYTVSRTSAATFTVLGLPPTYTPPYEIYVVIGVVVIVIVILLVTCLLKRRQTVAK